MPDEVELGATPETCLEWAVPKEENVTALLYRRRSSTPAPETKARNSGRELAFDPVLVFTAVLVGCAILSQAVFLLALEF